MTTTATPRRHDRAPLSSVDSNVVGSLRKKKTISRSPHSKQQKRFSTKTTKTPGTTKKKKRKSQKKKSLTVKTQQIDVSPLLRQHTANQAVAEATVFENVVALSSSATADVLSTTQLSEQITKFTFGNSGVLYDSQQWEAEQSEAFKSWLNHLFHPTPEVNVDAVSEEQRSAELNAGMKLFNSRRMSAIRFAIEREVTEGRLAITPRASRNILDEVYVQEQLSTLLLSYTSRWLQMGLEVVLAHHGDQRLQQHQHLSKEALKKIILEQVLSKPSAVQKYTAGNASGYTEQMLRVEIQQHTLSILLILVFFLDEAKTRQLLTEDPVLFDKTSQVKSSQEMLISLCQDCFAKQRSILNHLEYEGISVSYVQEPLDEYDFRVRNFAVDLKDGVCLAKMMDIVTNGCNILSSLRLPADSRKHKMYNVRLALAALRQLGVPNISDITPAHIVDAHQPRIIQLVWSTILYFELPEFRQEIIQYKASRLIQGQVRRFLATKSYQTVLRGCVSLQSLFRGVRLRERVVKMNCAARDIQKMWRGYDSKVRYGFDLLDILTVQSVVRRFLACRRVALLSRRVDASIQIQKIWRGYHQMIQYGFELLDIITAQSMIRRFLAAKRAKERLDSVFRIQSAARVWTAKRTVARCQDAIVKIQSSLRKSLAMKYFALQRKELVGMEMTIDSDSNPLHLRDCDIEEEEEEEGEVINYSTKQSRRRGETVSLIQCAELEPECSIDEEIEESFSSQPWEDDVSISTRASSMSEDLELASEIEQDLASMVIQIHWRRHLCSARYTMTRNAIITCQSICRRWIAQKKSQNFRLARLREELASVKVTSFVRGCFVRRKYMKTLVAATTIQKIVRGNNARKIVEEMKCFQIFLTWEESATKIQAQFRRHVCKSLYRTVLHGVVLLQARSRSIHAMKAFSNMKIARSQAASLIQNTYRSFLAQKRAAIIIQSAFRRHFLKRKQCLAMNRAAICIQATLRSKQSRESFLLHLKCIRIMQRAVRKFLAASKMKQVAATNIQRVWRGYSANVDFMLLVLAAMKIQSVARMCSALSTYHRNRNGIIITQACFRSRQARKLISSQQRSSIILQKVGRGFLARQRKKEQLAAVAILQRAAREMVVRSQNEINVLAATEIQRVWRGFSAHIDFMMQVMAAMKIQARYRELRSKRALLLISSQRKSSTIIQKVGRGFLARVKKERVLYAVVTIQHAARRMILHSQAQDTMLLNSAASDIQRIWRGFSAHVDYMLQLMAVIRIQSCVRCFLLNKRRRCTVGKSNIVQESDFLNDGVAKETTRANPHQKEGRSPPRLLSESPEMAMDSPRDIDVIACESNSKQELGVPKIITTTSYIAPPKKINVRSLPKYEKHTAKAIKVLRKSEIFSEVLEAASILVKTTNKSFDCCKLLLKARGQDNLLSLLSSCNRSSLHLELVRVILRIFRNISEHRALLSELVTRESLSVLRDVVQMFRDKADIFESSTSLIETFVRSDAFILSEHSSHEQRRCLREILSLSRKRASLRPSPQLDKGITCLENVICIIEGGTILESKPKCPYCDRAYT